MLEIRPIACAACVALLTTGCIETIVHPASEPRPLLEEPATAVSEVAAQEPVAQIAERADGVDVTVTRRTLCRVSADQPAEEEHRIERKLTAAGWIGQAVLGTTAVGAGVAGGYLVAEPCSLGSAVGVGCLEPVSDVGMGVGVGAIVASGLLSAALLGQGLSALDSTESTPVAPARVQGNWQACRLAPVAGAQVELWFSDGYVAVGRTDRAGRTRFEWSAIPTSHVYVSFPKARVRFAERDIASVSFRASSLFVRSQRTNAQYRIWQQVQPGSCPPKQTHCSGSRPAQTHRDVLAERGVVGALYCRPLGRFVDQSTSKPLPGVSPTSDLAMRRFAATPLSRRRATTD